MKISNYEVSLSSQNFTQEFVMEDNFTDFIQTQKSTIIQDTFTPKQNLTSDEIRKELCTAILRNLLILSKRRGIEFSFSQTQSTYFQTKALVQTTNKEYEVDISLYLKSSFTQNFGVNKLKFFDPLILSFDGNAPELSEKSFSFDIDMDGSKDQISILDENSAFLCLDKNNNGKIDDGGELFGTKSGNGFLDLKGYDLDNNNWIDENDEIFHKLRVWQKTPFNDKLLALGEVGIGAIYLGSSQTDFTIKSNSNQTLGQMRQSGFFLKENGQGGIISQIDLAKQKKSNPTLEDALSINRDKDMIFTYLNEKIKDLEVNSIKPNT